MAESHVLFEPPPGPENPLGMLTACHRRLEDRLDAFDHALAELPSERAREAIARLQHYLAGAGILHTADEEVSLFPRLPDQAAAIATLEREHEGLERTWRALLPRLLALPGADRDALETAGHAFVADYRTHLKHEEQGIFAAAAKLDADTLAQIGREMAKRRD